MEAPNAPRLDLSINITTLLSVLAMLVTATLYLGDKVNTLAEVVADQKTMAAQISDIERQILINRQETLKNRQVYLEGEQ